MGPKYLGVIAVLAVVTLLIPASVNAEDEWLSSPLSSWNQAGMAIPDPPTDLPSSVDPMCAATVRPPETPEDQAVSARGWLLFGPYQGGWGLRVVGGTRGFDGMCRPNGYQ